MGPGSTPGHKTRPAAGRWAVCTERHQNTSLPNTSKIGRGGGSTVELLLPEHCCCYGGKLGCLWRPFWLFSTYKKQGGSKKYFFRKKKGIWGHNRGPPYAHFFIRKIFFRPSWIFHRQEQPKRPPNPPGLASIAAAVLWQRYFNCHNRGPPYAHFFYEKKLFSAQLDFPPSRTAKKTPKTARACFHSYSSALATVFQLPQPWAN